MLEIHFKGICGCYNYEILWLQKMPLQGLYLINVYRKVNLINIDYSHVLELFEKK